jgi:hypothetical protein
MSKSTTSGKEVQKKAGNSAPALDGRFYARRHLRIGWWSVLVFLTLGLVLESLLGFKVGWYVDASSSTRRLLFTLAHAHGTLLGLLHIAFAWSVQQLPEWEASQRALAANCLVGAGVLIPGGFFLGGMRIYAGDPGVGIVLVPVGALLLGLAVFLAARAASRAK